jgi:hypothetical protein
MSEYIQLLEKFNKVREKLVASVEDFCNLLSKMTYFSDKVLTNTIGEAVSSNRFEIILDDEYQQLNDKLINLVSLLDGILNQLGSALSSAVDVTSDQTDKNISGFNLSQAKELHRSMLQQFLFEQNILQFLQEMYQSRQIDSDGLITSIASFKYAPYLSNSQLLLILQNKS